MKELQVSRAEPATSVWFDEDINDIPIGSEVGATYHDMLGGEPDDPSGLIELADGSVFTTAEILAATGWVG